MTDVRTNGYRVWTERRVRPPQAPELYSGQEKGRWNVRKKRSPHNTISLVLLVGGDVGWGEGASWQDGHESWPFLPACAWRGLLFNYVSLWRHIPPSLPGSTAKGFVLGDLARNARERETPPTGHRFCRRGMMVWWREKKDSEQRGRRSEAPIWFGRGGKSILEEKSMRVCFSECGCSLEEADLSFRWAMSARSPSRWRPIRQVWTVKHRESVSAVL